jgi:predicted phosphodiesterase
MAFVAHSTRAFLPTIFVLASVLLTLCSGCVPAGLAEVPAGGAWQQTNPGGFRAGPYLIRDKPGNMYVVMKGKTEKPPSVSWWIPASPEHLTEPPSGQTKTVTAQLSDGLWLAHLSGLPLDTEIAYTVSSSLGQTPPTAFKAGASRGKPFTFAAFGDTRTNHNVHRAVIDAVAEERVDFFVHTGDMVEYGGREPEWDLFFRIEDPLMRQAPIFPAIGNHDRSPRDYFGQYFLTTHWADSLAYYYQDWGDLRIVAVDDGIECRDGCVQNFFARKALADGAKKNMLMMIILHLPPYSSGAHGSYEYVQRPVEELAVEYGVELIISGHDHNYERTKPIKGITYLVSGAAGAPIRPVRKEHFSAVVRTEPHYILLDVNKRQISLRSTNLKGEVFDTTLIHALPATSPLH